MTRTHRSPPGPSWASLAQSVDGEVDLPGSPGFEKRALAFNARFDHLRPKAIVRCTTPEDVAETIRFVTAERLGHAVRSGGHCFAGRSSTSGVLIDVGAMRAASVAGGTVRAGAGISLGELHRQLDRHGVTVPAGTCPDVGLAGLALGGGLGILGRTHGITSDQVRSAQIVLADGRIVDCDDERHSDLFWALRGAGAGTFGVVTTLELATVAAPAATSFHLSWPVSSAVAIVDAWQRWAPTGPDELAASLKITSSGSLDRPPSVDLYGTLADSEDDADDLVDRLVTRAGAPTTAVRRHQSHTDTRRFWAELGDSSAPASTTGAPIAERPHLRARSEFFNRYLPIEAIEELLHRFGLGRRPDESRELDFMPWAGAYNRRPAPATAFVHRDERFILKHAVVEPAADRDVGRRWVDASWEAVHPWGSNRVFQNFVDPELVDPSLAYHGSNLPRLRQIKSQYDPTGFFPQP